MIWAIFFHFMNCLTKEIAIQKDKREKRKEKNVKCSTQVQILKNPKK
jgi:hypothetical protein